MAEEAKKNNKNLIIGICVAVLAIVVVVVAVIFATKGTAQLNDAYFVSTDTRYVLTEEGDGSTFEGTEYVPVKTHLVNEHSGETITSVINYTEFKDEATAKAALKALQEQLKDANLSEYGIKSISTNGKYLVMVFTEDQYKGFTFSEAKELYEGNYEENTTETNESEETSSNENE